MAYSHSYIPYSDTGYFSRLVSDYLAADAKLDGFYQYFPDEAGVARAIADRSKFPVNRRMLVSVLRRQYGATPDADAALANIERLGEEQTFTVTTAHQPNLMTGYLYFVYKILHAIRLAEELNKQYPDKHFVPVYYMGSEDNDLDELGVFRFRGEKYRWDAAGQTGAVGRMDTASLKDIVNTLLRRFGPPGTDCESLKEMIVSAYAKHKTIGAATHALVHSLFGKYGLVILDPDDRELKRAFVPVMEQELLEQSSLPVVNAQTEKMERNYKSQLYARPINLFYLHDQQRERIEYDAGRWVVKNTDISFDKHELLAALHEYPERFSPNVALRGLFQETILPDVVFIGGGAEVAYWLQLMPLFQQRNVFYPVVMLRQSVMWIGEQAGKMVANAHLEVPQLFTPLQQQIRDYVTTHAEHEHVLAAEYEQMKQVMAQVEQAVAATDSSLALAAKAVLARMEKGFKSLEKKMYRAERRKHEVHIARIEKAYEAVFPGGGLQERVDNFMEYYLDEGSVFIDVIKNAIEPLRNQFLIVEKRAD